MKALNVFAIILAWLLSIALVIMLAVAPVTLSALSVLDPEKIIEAVGEGMVKTDDSAAAPQKEYGIENLSSENKGKDLSSALGALEKIEDPADIGEYVMEHILGAAGEEADEEMVKNILDSDFTKELLGAYVEDFTNVLTGKTDSSQFTAEKIAKVVEDNLDEVLDIIVESGEELTAEQKAQLKDEVQKLIKENTQEIAKEILNAVPTPEKLLESNGDFKAIQSITAQKDRIKLLLVGAIAVLALLIFAFRYPGFRGLRWLSTNLFVAGGINVVICMILSVASAAIVGIVEGLNAMELISVDGIVSELLSQLTTGVIVRTVIIFVAAIVLLVAYIVLKKFVVQKKMPQPVVTEAIPEAAPAFVPTPAPETAPVAPEYTAVTIEPELMAETAPEMAEKSNEGN